MKLILISATAILLALPVSGRAQDAEFTRQVASAQREAIAAFPDIGKAGSELNKRFVSEYQRLKAASDALLNNPNWPKILANRSAEDLGVKPMTGNDGTPSTTAVQTSPLRLTPGGSRATICGHVLQKVAEGMLVTCAEDQDERRDIPGAPRGKYVMGAPLANGIVLLVGHPGEKGMADEDAIANVIAVEAGTYEYTAVSNSTKTVRVYQYVTGR